jgi:invasion protein IalB
MNLWKTPYCPHIFREYLGSTGVGLLHVQPLLRTRKSQISLGADGAITPRTYGLTEYHLRMIRDARSLSARFALLAGRSGRIVCAVALSMGFCAVAAAQERTTTRPAAKPDAKPAAKAQSSQPAASGGPGKPVQVATSGDWGVYVTSGAKDKQCYALSQPKKRSPEGLNRDPAFLFISTRPGEKVRNEVSIIMGFDVKSVEKAPPEAGVGTEKFALAAQGAHLWIRDAAKGVPMIDAMRKGSNLTVRAASQRGNVTTDSYSLSGLSGALERVQKECP